MGIFEQLGQTASDLWGLAQHKHDLEQRHDLSLTTDAPGAGWSPAHLEVLESSLGRLPSDHVAPLESIALGLNKGWGAHLGDHLWLSHKPEALGAGEKHGGDTSVLAGHDDPVRQLEMTVAHEVGHEVQENHADAAAKILEAAGWRSGLDMAATGLGRDEILAILSESGGELEQGGSHFMLDVDAMAHEAARRQERGESVNAMAPLFQAYEEDFVPMEGAHNGDNVADSWNYARTDPGEYFAEMYTKAANLPELLYEDLIAEPEGMIEAAELSGDTAEAERWREAARRKRVQWDVMRGEVFGVNDTLIEERVGDLEMLHGASDPRALDEIAQSFRADAQRVMTPDQLDRLLDRYLQT